MTKSSKPTTYPEEIPKDGHYLENLDKEAFFNYPSKAEWRKRLRFTLFKWAELETSETIMDFCIAYKIPRKTLTNWTTQYADIKETVDEVKLILANRDIKGAKHRKFDKDVVFRYLHRLDPDEDDINKYHASLKANDGVDTGTRVVQYIIEEKTPSTGRVPPNPRKKIEEVEEAKE